jgi:hypothetical protein
MDAFLVVVISTATIGGYIVGRLQGVNEKEKALSSLRRTISRVRLNLLCAAGLAVSYHEIAKKELRLLDNEPRMRLEQELQTLDSELASLISEVKEHI